MGQQFSHWLLVALLPFELCPTTSQMALVVLIHMMVIERIAIVIHLRMSRSSPASSPEAESDYSADDEAREANTHAYANADFGTA
jgi:hypothetical protein